MSAGRRHLWPFACAMRLWTDGPRIGVDNTFADDH